MSMQSGYGYFIYSTAQMEFQKAMEEKVGKIYHVGTVIVGGRRRSFTELNRNGKSRFSDAMIVAEGEVGSYKYTMPKGE